MLDPYAQAVLSRRNWGQLAPDLDWNAPGVLGFASTWPQAACALPSTDEFDWEGVLGVDVCVLRVHVRNLFSGIFGILGIVCFFSVRE